MYGTIWALVPPIVAIVLALLVKEAYFSLFTGVLLGALFVSNFNLVATLDTVVNDGLIAAIGDNAGIFLFLVLLGIIVALVNRAGGSAAFGRWAERNIKTRVGAMLATFLLGVLIFIDDYFNCLTVGSVMRPVTDNHRISRAKLAFLIDATAAPQAGLPHRRDRRPDLHDCAGLVLGGRRLRRGRRPGHRHLRHPAFRARDPL